MYSMVENSRGSNLPRKQQTNQPGVRAQACNANICEVEAGGSGIQGHSDYRVSFMPGCSTGDPVSKSKKGGKGGASWQGSSMT